MVHEKGTCKITSAWNIIQLQHLGCIKLRIVGFLYLINFYHFVNTVKSNNRNTFAFYRLYQCFSFDPFGVGWCNNDGIGSHWNGP